MHARRSCYLFATVTLLGLLLAWPVHAQQDTTAARVALRLADGTTYVGTIVQEDATVVTLRTAAGVEIAVPRAQIEALERHQGVAPYAAYWRSDPNASRLFVGATARPLAAGAGYFAAYEIFFPAAAVGVANVAVLAGGISLIPGSTEQLLYAAPKVTLVNRNSMALAVGTFIGTITGSGEYLGFAYGVGTIGRPERAVTVGVGFAYAKDELDESAVLILGGEIQVSESVKLISENYIVPSVDGGVVASAGLRFFGERLAADLGFFTWPDLIDEGGFPFLPWLGFAYNFGY